MAIRTKWLCMPRPKAFFYCMSLRTGAEMISLSMLFNKVAGIFGLLAILTGFKLDGTQLSMYLYSVAALILLAYLMAHIRKQSPMQCLALAWFYTIDTIVNSTYTAAFSVTWFMTISASRSETHNSLSSGAPGGGMINDTAGFTSPKYNVTTVDLTTSPTAELMAGTDTLASGTAVGGTTSTEGLSLQNVVGMAEGAPSLFIIIMLTVIRIYFILVMMAYARHVLHQYMQTTSSLDGSLGSEESPFALEMPAGQGWRGKLGRMMLCCGKQYFLGNQVDDEWEKALNSRFRQQAPTLSSERRGTFERERRARNGTAPPRPLSEVLKLNS